MAAATWARGMLVSPFRDQLPARLPPAVMCVDSIPFGRLFPRAAAVVHHGGIGTSAQALKAGVPQLVMPMAFDQHDNADRLVRLAPAGCFLRADSTAAPWPGFCAICAIPALLPHHVACWPIASNETAQSVKPAAGSSEPWAVDNDAGVVVLEATHEQDGGAVWAETLGSWDVRFAAPTAMRRITKVLCVLISMC